MSVKRLLKITSSSLVNPDEYASKGFEDSLLHVSLIQMLLERNGFLALRGCLRPYMGVIVAPNRNSCEQSVEQNTAHRQVNKAL